MSWEIVYVDGSVFTSRDGNPEDAPRLGVHAVLQDDPTHGCLILTSSDGRWYWRYGRWWASDIPGITLYLATSVGSWNLVLFGEWIPDERLLDIQRIARGRAANWKSSWRPDERRVVE